MGDFMNLGLVSQLKRLFFKKEITLVDEYEDTIKEIKKTIKQIDGGLQLFYRRCLLYQGTKQTI